MQLPTIKTLFLASLVFTASAHAELPPDYKVVLLTSNFPPFNLSADGKNFARDEAIQGIGADTVREAFKRAGIAYSMTLRFPWERLYQQALLQPDHGLFSTTITDARRDQFKWVGPIAHYDSVLLAAPGSGITLDSLDQARQYRIGGYKDGGTSEYLEAQGIAHLDALHDEANLRKLLNGDIDLWATADAAWRHYAEQDGVEGLKPVLRFHTSPLYLALNKATPDEVVERLQAAMDQIIDEGYAGCAKTPDLCYLIRDRKALAASQPLN
ncbi:ABC transporter substrate-binding protein [Stutzerimonas urumqiensis]|uniref:substrate-binding periplasmic protein n=1 Tax=Stutzerimonas urumqiensis TaxID=638269 RepID=UPI003BAB7232